MTNKKLVECLEYCVQSTEFVDCIECPFMHEKECPADVDYSNCTDTLMKLAAEALRKA